MTDSEHEYLLENERLRAELDRVRQIAVRALTEAILAQDAATGRHETWLDSALEAAQAPGGPRPVAP